MNLFSFSKDRIGLLGALCTIVYESQYYVLNIRNNGLWGRGAFNVWRLKLFPSVPRRPNTMLVDVAGPGDARAAAAFIQAMAIADPAINFCVCCVTVPAREYLLPLASERVFITYLPFDTRLSMRRLLRNANPLILVAMQATTWPYLLVETRRRGVPICLLRGDFPEWASQVEVASFLRPFFEFLLGLVDHFSTRSSEHAARLLAYGVPSKRIAIGGNYRFETVPEPNASKAEHYRAALSIRKQVIVLANPRLDEIREIANTTLVHLEGFQLIVAPAELDVAIKAYKLISSIVRGVRRRSQLMPGDGGWRILILDTHGELFDIYALADIAILGDTFPPQFSIGANPWEPLIQGCRVISGSLLPDFEFIDPLVEAGHVKRVGSYGALVHGVEELLQSVVPRDDVISETKILLRFREKASSIDVRLVTNILEQLKLSPLGRTHI